MKKIYYKTIKMSASKDDGSKFHSIIAIGNPIVDISAEINEEDLKKYELKWGDTVFANEKNKDFYEFLQSKPDVSYIPGGSIQNTLRIASWLLSMEEEKKDKYSITMLGAVGKDEYKDKIVVALEKAGVKPLLEPIPDMFTSRCGVGIYKKERSLLTEIRASNCLTDEFVKENEEKIYANDAFIIEGYFLQEKFELCKKLCTEFKKRKKLIILTFSAVFMVQAHYDKILEIANQSDLVISNMEEMEAFSGCKGAEYKPILEKAFRKLKEGNRLFVCTDGCKGVIVSQFNYKKNMVDFILQSFPETISPEEMVDLNGAGDAFLGGFLSQYMRGRSLNACCRAGNDASRIILKNVGCTFSKDDKIEFGK